MFEELFGWFNEDAAANNPWRDVTLDANNDGRISNMEALGNLNPAMLGAGFINQQLSAPQRAADAQQQEIRRGIGDIRDLLGPISGATQGGLEGLGSYQQAGVDAVGMQRALLGLDGPEAQQQAIAMLEASPAFTSMVQQGEEALLANASATGGLRGGNTQQALAQLRPQMLAGLIQQQLGGLGGLAGMGLSGASQVAGIGAGAAGQQAGLQAGLRDTLGASRAGAVLGNAQASQNLANQGANLAGTGLGAGLKMFLGGGV